MNLEVWFQPKSKMSVYRLDHHEIAIPTATTASLSASNSELECRRSVKFPNSQSPIEVSLATQGYKAAQTPNLQEGPDPVRKS